MSETSPLLGHCLCKGVSVEIQKPAETFTVCHCRSCRKWSGGVSMSLNGGPNLKFLGDEFVGRYASSKWAERCFCKTCGTHLFFRLKKNHYFLFRGLFDEKITPKFELQEFIDEKPDFYSFANSTKTQTKAESFQMLEDYLSRP